MNKKNLKRGWITLGLWLSGMMVLHIINRIFHIKINSIAMFVCSTIAIIMILLINRFYTHEIIHFEWYGFRRIGWLICEAIIFILITNATFKTSPSETNFKRRNDLSTIQFRIPTNKITFFDIFFLQHFTYIF